MFYQQLERLCFKKGMTPTSFVTSILKLSSSKITAWKNGSIPKYRILEAIAYFFDVPISFLFGDEELNDKNNKNLSDEEKLLLTNFNKLDLLDKGRVIERVETLAELAVQNKGKTETAVEFNPGIKKKPPLRFLTDEEISKIDHSAYSVTGIYVGELDTPASAGTGVYIDDVKLEPVFLKPSEIIHQADYVMRILGNSMEPVYSDGDKVLVQRDAIVEEGEVGIFVLNGEVYIKRLGRDMLLSYNPFYRPINVGEGDSLYCRGKVLGKAETI